jgi:NTE family protein
MVPGVLLLWFLVSATTARAQSPASVPIQPHPPVQAAPAKPAASTSAAGGKAGDQGGESKSASASDVKGEVHASGKETKLGPLDPAPAPRKVFARPRIGLALGGGGALGLTEVGVLKWFEEHHIPVDEIAGTSMGCLVSSLYSTGLTPDQIVHIVNDRVFTSVFAFSTSYTAKSFRRREESRELPNGVTIGLRNHVSFRNAVLVDQGLNAFLDREFLRYDDQTEFNNLPIPLRCVSTDLNDAKSVVFSRGSIPDSVRASLSIPGIFPPFEMGGHEYVDGQVLENLPTPALISMQPDVVLAVSLPLGPVAQGSLGSILGVFARAYEVATEQLEVQDRKLAKVVVTPDITGYNVTDYLKADDLAKRGYDAAEKNKDALMPYSISDADWQAYLAHRRSLVRGPAAPVLEVRVTAPGRSATLAVQRLFAPLVNQPVDTAKIEALLDQVRSDGAFDADYTVGYETAGQFHAQETGAAPLPQGTVDVAPTTKIAAPANGDAPVTPPPSPSPNGISNNTQTVQPAGAPVPKASTAPSSNQPGVARSSGSTDIGPAYEPPQEQTALASRPGAPGLSNTQEATATSLADIPARPIILVQVTRKKIGPPFLVVGANVEAQTSSFTRATIEGVLLDQDFGGYGSELRSRITLGYLTELGSEYFHPLNPLGPPDRTYFVTPHVDFLREPFPIYNLTNNHLATRQLQRTVLGFDTGWTNLRTQQFRAGLDFQHLNWNIQDGSDALPNFTGDAERARLQYDYDTQDRALVPQYGIHLTAELGYLFSAVNSPNAPSLSSQITFAHKFDYHHPIAKNSTTKPGKEVFVVAAEGGTLFDRNVAQPFRFTLGGPARLTASSIDQYRGTDYWLIEPAILHRIAQLPAPLGQNLYLGAGLEAGQMYAPGQPVINRQDGYFGVVAETPLGVITLAPAIGSNGEYKLVFTLGKVF